MINFAFPDVTIHRLKKIKIIKNKENKS